MSYVNDTVGSLKKDDKHPWVPPIICTENLVLRPIDEQDAEDIFDYAQDPDVSKYTLWENHKSIIDSLAYIKKCISTNYRHQIPDPFVIALKEDKSRVVGTVGCFNLSRQHRSMELGFALSKKHWGNGIIPEASTAILAYAFEEYDLERIHARCKSENLASARVLEKISMKYEGTWRSSVYHRERFWDMKYYSMLRSEWALVKQFSRAKILIHP